MTPSVETLAALLEKFSVAVLTLVDGAARPRSRALRTVRSRFTGHIWLRGDDDPRVMADLGRGADVSLAFGSSAAGPYVAVHGWAIVLRNAAYARSLSSATRCPGLAPRSAAAPLVCVTAHAAEMWESASESPRVFAFPHVQPTGVEESTELLHAVARSGWRSPASLSEAGW